MSLHSKYSVLKGMGLVYIIGNDAYQKIGFSHNETVAPRLQQIQIYLPFDAAVLRTWNTHHYRVLESALHTRYATCRLRGEWFRLSAETIMDCDVYVGQFLAQYDATLREKLRADAERWRKSPERKAAAKKRSEERMLCGIRQAVQWAVRKDKK
jgi:hypothetical protein